MSLKHKIQTFNEWVICLAYPPRAKKTWLRIEPKHERIATIISTLIVIFLAYLYLGRP